MGYYTSFELSIVSPRGEALPLEDFTDLLNPTVVPEKYVRMFTPEHKRAYDAGRLRAKEVPAEIKESLDYFMGGNAMKWYEHEAHMTTLSKMFPEFIFVLEGHGEETDDHWRKYFFRGRMQGGKAKVVYPPLDIKSLTEGL